jgi:nucleoside-diphosphate-sugar epimerase
MRVFVTGASGWIGRGLVPELASAGHEVTGLARSDASAKALRAAGAGVRLGSLDDLGTLRDAAASSDGVIHLAFKHDIAFTGDFAGATAADRAAIDTFGEALAGTGKPFVIASGILGVLGLPPGVVATERDGLAAGAGDRKVPISGANGRMANAHYTSALAGHGVRSSVVRLPPATHGNGDNGFIPTAIGFARENGAAAYVGDGANRWPAVHRDDAARLFRLALESGPPGSVLHAVGDEGVPVREVAEIFAAHLGVPAVSVTPGQAAEYVGFLGGFWGFDGPASAQITRDLLGWEPTRPGLIADLKAGHYFA